MQAGIRHFQAGAGYFYSDERCHINELSNSHDDPDVSIAEVRVEPGQTTRWHRLTGITERYVLLSGRGRVEIGNLPPEEVASGAVVLIPPGCRQRISNIGNETLVFLAICSPRFEQKAYEAMEDNRHE